MLKKINNAIRYTLSLTKNKKEVVIINNFTKEVSSLVLYNIFSDESLNRIDELLYNEGQDIILDFLIKLTLTLRVNENISLTDIEKEVIEALTELYKDTDIGNTINVKVKDKLYYLVFVIALLNVKGDESWDLKKYLK